MNEKMKMPCGNLYLEGKKGWFMWRSFSQLFEVDLDTYESYCIADCPEIMFKEYAGMIGGKEGDILYIFPYLRGNIWTYDLRRSEFKKLEIDGFKTANLALKNRIINYKKEIYAMSEGLKKIIEIDKQSCKTNCHYLEKVPEGPCVQVSIDERACSAKDGTVLLFNASNKKVQYFSHPEPIKEGRLIGYDPEGYWITEYMSQIYFWNLKEIFKIGLPLNIKKNSIRKFSRCCIGNRFIWLLVTGVYGKIIYIDRKSKNANLLTIEHLKNGDEKAEKFYIRILSELNGEYLFLQSEESGDLFILDMENAVSKKIDFTIKEKQYRKIRQEKLYEGSITENQFWWDMPSVIKLIDLGREPKKAKDNIGKHIFHAVCKS